MLEHGCDASIQEPQGWTVFHQAAHSGDVELLRVLLQTSIRKQVCLIQTGGGATPFHLACQQGWQTCLDLLYTDGVDSYFAHGMSSIHVATIQNHLDIVKYLIEDREINKDLRTADGKTSLYLAAEHDCLDILQYLIR